MTGGARRAGCRAAGEAARSPRIVLLCALALALSCACAATTAAAQAQPAIKLHLGTQTLTLCQNAPLAYCGTLPVPLDRGTPSGPQISIAYRWYPATAPPGGQASGTVVPVEGGPGYPSIGSVSYQSAGAQAGYSAMYGSAAASAGTCSPSTTAARGSRTPLRCPALQDFSGPTGGEAFQQAAAGCAAALNHRWRYADGSWVHASDLFNSAPAAEDLAAVIARARRSARSTCMATPTARSSRRCSPSRFPQLVRSVMLDSTYETVDLDPWYRSTIDSMPAAFDAACEPRARLRECRGRPLVAADRRARRKPARAPDLRRRAGTRRCDAERSAWKSSGLVNLVSDAAEDTQHLPRAGRRRPRAARRPRSGAAAAPVRAAARRRRGVLRRCPCANTQSSCTSPSRASTTRSCSTWAPSPAVRAQRTGGRRGGAARGDVRPVQHRRVARPGPEHRGVHRVPATGPAPTVAAAADVGRAAAVSQLAACARPRRRIRHVDARRPTSPKVLPRSAATRASSSWPTPRTWSARATPRAAPRSCRSSSPNRRRSTRSTPPARPRSRRSTRSACTPRQLAEEAAARGRAGERRAERRPAARRGGGDDRRRCDRALRGDRSQARPRPARRAR